MPSILVDTSTDGAELVPAPSPKQFQKYLKSIMDYNSDTGVFTRTKSVSQNTINNKIPGYLDRGRPRIGVNGRYYYASVLAWVYCYGEWPSGLVDHKDQDPTNNRLDNLRIATRAQNKENSKTHRNNRSGLKGVSVTSSGKWVARITVDKKTLHIGVFATKEEAFFAYKNASRLHHREFSSPNS